MQIELPSLDLGFVALASWSISDVFVLPILTAILLLAWTPINRPFAGTREAWAPAGAVADPGWYELHANGLCENMTVTFRCWVCIVSFGVGAVLGSVGGWQMVIFGAAIYTGKRCRRRCPSLAFVLTAAHVLVSGTVVPSTLLMFCNMARKKLELIERRIVWFRRFDHATGRYYFADSTYRYGGHWERMWDPPLHVWIAAYDASNLLSSYVFYKNNTTFASVANAPKLRLPSSMAQPRLIGDAREAFSAELAKLMSEYSPWWGFQRQGTLAGEYTMQEARQRIIANRVTQSAIAEEWARISAAQDFAIGDKVYIRDGKEGASQYNGLRGTVLRSLDDGTPTWVVKVELPRVGEVEEIFHASTLLLDPSGQKIAQRQEKAKQRFEAEATTVMASSRQAYEQEILSSTIMMYRSITHVLLGVAVPQALGRVVLPLIAGLVSAGALAAWLGSSFGMAVTASIVFLAFPSALVAVYSILIVLLKLILLRLRHVMSPEEIYQRASALKTKAMLMLIPALYLPVLSDVYDATVKVHLPDGCYLAVFANNNSEGGHGLLNHASSSLTCETLPMRMTYTVACVLLPILATLPPLFFARAAFITRRVAALGTSLAEVDLTGVAREGTSDDKYLEHRSSL